MNLKSLLLCREPQVLRTLEPLLGEMGVTVAVCPEVQFCMDMFWRRRFDAVIVDMEVRDAECLLKALRRAPANKNVVALALVNGHPTPQAAFEMGATFVVHKPISPERARITLRAAHSLMCRDRRDLNRRSMQMVALLYPENGKEVWATVPDLSDTGMLVSLAEPVPGNRAMRVSLPLAGARDAVQFYGEVVWADSQGRVGLRFVQPSRISQKELLTLWLGQLSSLESGPLRPLLVPASRPTAHRLQ